MFKNRFDAGQQLSEKLQEYKSDKNSIILAIPRGAIELGSVLAKNLGLPLDVIFSKKIGYPGNPEFAIGAASESHYFVNERFKDIPELQEYIKSQVESIRKVIKQRNKKYRQGMAELNLKDKNVIIVDDGVATGNTLLATIALIKEYEPKKIVVALPVSSIEALNKIEEVADEVICLEVPVVFYSVSQFYENFDQVEDEDAIKLLHEANE